MKKQKFLFGALTALAMGAAFTACSDDPVNDGIDNGKVEKDQTRYINVTICTPTQGSRAESTDATFEAATKEENYVKTLYFAFYDANGDWIYTAPFEFKNNTNDEDGDEGVFNPSGEVAGTAGNVGKIWTSTVGINLSAGQNMPSYVMAFVNPVTPADITNSSMSSVEGMLRQDVQNVDKYFPMSNSVFYGNNPITGETNVRMVATPITTTQLATSIDEAKEKPAVEIFVERYAAKINLTMATNAIANNANQMDAAKTPAVNGYTLKFVPEYWRPNAIDKDMYVLKHYAINTSTTGTPVINAKPTYTELNNLLQWGWNDAANNRSYWGCSPSYYDAKYPKVSDNIEDGGTYALHYFSYNEIVDPSTVEGASFKDSKPANADGSFSGAFYSRETTASATAWKNATAYNPVATVAGAVIIGRYELTDPDGTAMDKKTTFWLYGKTDGKWNLYDTKAKITEAMAKQQNIVLDKATKQPVRVATPFIVEHPKKAVRTAAGATVAGRFVALQIDNETVPTGYCYYDATVTGDDKYVDITAANVNEVNVALLTAGYARQYGEGLAYYNVPIQHIGFNTADYTDGKLDWTKARAGSFGLVRNHVYTINIESINGLATALRDADQPIVPPMDEQTYYVSAKLNVLNWRIVPAQNVQL